MKEMDKNIDNIFESVKNLSLEDKNKLLFFLQQEQLQNLSPKEKEIISFMTENQKKLEQCNKELKDLHEKNKEFFNELKKST